MPGIALWLVNTLTTAAVGTCSTNKKSTAPWPHWPVHAAPFPSSHTHLSGSLLTRLADPIELSLTSTLPLAREDRAAQLLHAGCLFAACRNGGRCYRCKVTSPWLRDVPPASTPAGFKMFPLRHLPWLRDDPPASTPPGFEMFPLRKIPLACVASLN